MLVASHAQTSNRSLTVGPGSINPELALPIGTPPVRPLGADALLPEPRLR